MTRYVGFAFLLLTAIALGSPQRTAASDDALVLTLQSAVASALARDALVRDAKQSLESARAALIREQALTPRLSMSSSTSAASSAGLDPNSVITGTSYSSQYYSSNLQVPMRGGTSLNLSSSAGTTTTNSSLRTGEGMSFTFASAAASLGLSRPLSLFRKERVLTEGGRWSAELSLRSAELAFEEARRRVVGDTLTCFFAALLIALIGLVVYHSDYERLG